MRRNAYVGDGRRSPGRFTCERSNNACQPNDYKTTITSPRKYLHVPYNRSLVQHRLLFVSATICATLAGFK